MEQDKKDPLKVISETPLSDPLVETKKEEEKKSKFELPDSYLLAQEMREMFDEDRVTHVQGGSEPEAD